ncbi:MAG: DUF2703 domain-containing protein [Cyanomargarita calcarea GSE-NOS-MK-12-04C]|jgi:hypothetical protein|uniref:DUF2703 domain-containing protein n=1 Tax=Cyanomargarita calcarea GSE-NOS-MK-12-04C TaxID=2839659 RepID=A0A951URX8_9CYAN|nr:DUF2703 domain-containing protein [Cyanomargarita calcarea GSE-NOS-MK-12-04C]
MTTTTTFNHSPRTLNIELLAIDLSTCSRCTGSLSNVEQAIASLQQVLASTNTVIQFQKILVESEAQAKQLQFVSSPTIRVNGRDVILETTESRCGDCSEISGSSQGTACRTWSYQGQSYTEAPVGMIVDAILREIYQNLSPIPVISYPTEVPQNLQQFFRDKAKKATSCGTTQTVLTGCGCR